MFCVKCGKEVDNVWKNCPYCGESIETDIPSEAEEKQEENWEELWAEQWNESLEPEEYLFFEKFDGAQRETLNQVFKIIGKLCAGVTLIVSLLHIYNEVQAEEGYKWSLYLIRFVNTVGMYAVVEYIITEIAEWLELKKSQIRDTSSLAMAKALRIGAFFLAICGGIILLNPTGAEQLQILAAVANDSLVDYLKVTKLTWVLLIGAAVLKWIFDEKVLVEKKME